MQLAQLIFCRSDRNPQQDWTDLHGRCGEKKRMAKAQCYEIIANRVTAEKNQW